jgi:hypothetical protein
MHATTLSETRQHIEDVVEFAIEHIRTKTELDRFLTSVDVQLSETTDDKVRAMLVEIEERVFCEARRNLMDVVHHGFLEFIQL